MRGRLNWEGNRASQRTGNVVELFPIPVMVEGLTGLVHFRRWVLLESRI